MRPNPPATENLRGKLVRGGLVEAEAAAVVDDLAQLRTLAVEIRKESNRLYRFKFWRRLFAGVIAITLLVVAGVIVADHYYLSRCFLTRDQGSRPNWQCSALYPGYSKTVKTSDADLVKFNLLLEQIPANQRRIQGDEAEIVRLKAEIAQLQRSHG